MVRFPNTLQQKLDQRKVERSFRTLKGSSQSTDFSSNDYLGFARSGEIFARATEILQQNDIHHNGSSGSRLITGNHLLYEIAERQLADFHQAESALIFNSGYDANVGFFSSVLQRNDVVLYDEYCHASIRDGIRLSAAKAFKFRHNDLSDLEDLLVKSRGKNIYIATESIFSMDGDSPNLPELVSLSERYGAHLIVDEAHAAGIFGNGRGLLHEYGLADKIFAIIITFGKAFGCHGAAIIGSSDLKDYLINFARSFIYTTGLPPHAVATIIAAYEAVAVSESAVESLNENLALFFFETERQKLNLHNSGVGAIQTILVPGNQRVREVSEKLINEGFDVRPIMSPTVPQGMERLRICIHSFNSKNEIICLVSALSRALSA